MGVGLFALGLVFGGTISPPPGSSLTFSPYHRERHHQHLEFRRISGTMEIHPPKGQCWWVQNLRRLQKKICGKQQFQVFMEDLDEKGQIPLRIREGYKEQEFFWPTPYRIGKAVKIGHLWPGEADKILITSCKKDGKLLTFSIFNEETWKFYLPDQDSPVQIDQSPQTPNLYIVLPKSDNPLAGLEGPKVGPSSLSSHSWQMHPRHSYETSGDRFFATLSSPSGVSSSSRCRYRYQSLENEGLLECKNVDRFQWLYLPLTCLTTT